MIRRIIPPICLLAILSACSGIVPATASVEAISSTFMPSPTTILPTATLPQAVVPTTAQNRFSPHGPFLIFSDHLIRDSKIILYDPTQQSQLELDQPTGDILDWHYNYLSPDGEYMAYYTGDWQGLTDLSATPATPQHVELNIQRTADGAIVFRTSLLNEDYPHNFLAAADTIADYPPADFDLLEYTRPDLAIMLYRAFFDYLFTNAWSHRGHVLAFASGAGGPSSDVYTYNVDTGALNRITDGPSETYQIYWSPDDQWILNSGIYDDDGGPCGTWYLSAADGSGSSGFTTGGVKSTFPDLVRGCRFGGWVSDHQALVYEPAIGIAPFNLELMDIHQKTINVIWPHSFSSYTFDPVAQQAYLFFDGQNEPDDTSFEAGTYQVDAASFKAIKLAQDMETLVYAGWPNAETVLAVNTPDYSLCFLPAMNILGSMDTWMKQEIRIGVSDGHRYIAVGTGDSIWLVTQDSSGNHIEKIIDTTAENLAWSRNPGSNPADDWLLVFWNDSGATPYVLYQPATGELIPLSGFDADYFSGWGWRQ